MGVLSLSTNHKVGFVIYKLGKSLPYDRVVIN
jgi:hypothetical protein